MTVPPPPSEPPTIGQPRHKPPQFITHPDPTAPVGEWWRGPLHPREPDASEQAAPVDLTKAGTDPDAAPATDAGADDPADVGEDQAAEADDPEQPEAAAEADDDAPAWVDTLAQRLGTQLGTIISETPEERAERLRAEREARHEAAGETESERRARHRREAIARRQRASVLWRQPQSERARRFRRWCVLTTISASVGFAVHLPQALAHLPMPVGLGALGAAWLLDLKLRGGGHVRVTQVRGPVALTYLCVVRVPVASALVAVLGLGPLLALLNNAH
ncbi:hypothetical protein VM98_07755 [Streptomyces rubellomurinus subsp. indigoferus]|nr:hypothetical protein VM98_07755 [Streptomyces rubellomurinus subsp. indigoferus]